MNIWIINHYLNIKAFRGTIRHIILAEELKSRSHQVTLWGCDRHHFKKEREIKGFGLFRTWERDGIAGVWVNSIEYTNNSPLRYVNMILFAINLVISGLFIRKTKPDVIVGSSGHLFTAVAAWILSRRHRAHFIYEIRDIWPETLVTMGRLRQGSIIERVLRRLNSHLITHAAAIVGTIPGIRDYCARYLTDPQNVYWITNGVDLSVFHPIAASPDNDRGLKLVYFGSLGKPNAVDIIVEAMAIIRDDDQSRHIECTIIGDGSEKKQLHALCEQRKLENITFLDPVQREEIPRLVKDADAFVVVLRNCPEIYRYGVSLNKLAEYMALGKPVILGGDVPYNPLHEAAAGFVTPYEDSVALAAAVRALADMTVEERLAMGQRARAYAEEWFDYRKLGDAYADIVQQYRGK